MAELKIKGGSSTVLESIVFKGRGNTVYNNFRIGFNGDFNNIISIKFIDYDTKEELKDVELLVKSKSTNTSIGYSKTNEFIVVLPEDTTASKIQSIITYYEDTTDLSSIKEFKTDVAIVLPLPIQIFRNEKVIDKNNPTTFRVKRYGDDDVSIMMIPNNSTIDFISKTYNAPYYEYECQININSEYTNTSYSFYVDINRTQYGEEYGNALISSGRQEIKYTVVDRELVPDIEATITSTTPISTEFKGVNLIVDVNYIDDNEKDIPQLLYNNEKIDIIPQVINTIDNESNIYNYSYIIPPEYTDEDIKIIFQGYNTNKEITVKNIIPMDTPKIYTELLSATSIPSYGGTVKVKVLYEDYQSINTPTILFNGVRQTTNYMNDNSTMSNDLYNYIFDFPEAEEDRTITIRFQAMGEGNEIVKSDIQITQKGNGGTGGGGSDDDNNDEPPLIFDDVLILNSYGDEYNYEESEDTYTLQARVKTAIDDVVGELEVVTNVNWIRVDYNNGGDINHHYYKETVFNYTINIAENTNEVSRLTVVTFNYYNTNNELIDSKDYVVVQDAENQPTIIEYNSCWEDIIYTTDVDVFNYSVVMSTFVENDKSEEVTIFNGRAYKYPNSDNIEIKLNKIFENYLTNSLTNTISKLDLNSNIDYNNRNYESCKRFMIYDRDTSELIKEYRVLYDWSYTYKWRGEEEVLSKPIDNNFAYRQLHFNTTVSKMGIVTNYITNTINNDCGDYALYYLNSFGGWDSLLLNNKVNKSKSINSYTTEKYIRNLNVDFEQYRYISELQNSYDVNTNLLTDEQATNIVDNLFTSNEVYLHNLNTDIINAVLITNNKVSYKRYSDNLELPYFTINIKESQIQLKR